MEIAVSTFKGELNPREGFVFFENCYDGRLALKLQTPTTSEANRGRREQNAMQRNSRLF